MISRRLDAQLHGSDGFTTVPRLLAFVALVGAMALSMHIALLTWYNGRIMPGVSASGVEIGGMKITEARSALSERAKSFKLTINVADRKFVASAIELGVVFDVEKTVKTAYDTARKGGILSVINKPDPIPMAFSLDRAKLNIYVDGVASQVGVAPVDASASVSGSQVKTTADKKGRTIDASRLASLIEKTLKYPSASSSFSLETKPLYADIRLADLKDAVSAAESMMALSIRLAYEGREYRPSKEQIGQWIVFRQKENGDKAALSPVADSARIKEYAQSIGNDLYLAPVNKKVTVKNGVSSTTQEGREGRAVNQDDLTNAIIGAINNRQDLNYTIRTTAIAFKTTSTTVTTLEYGKYIEINLIKQHLWAWQDHNVVYQSPLTSGATGAGFGTVTGLFSIYYKTMNTYLNGAPLGYDYNVFVKYWMPFYSNYGLHDASWRSSFGGSDYYYGGSHGCVNLPYATAEFLYGWAPVGTPVWIHY